MGWVRLWALTGLCVLSLAGCGSEGDGGEAADPEAIRRAAGATEAKGGVRLEFSGTMEAKGIPDDIEFRGEGTENRRARTADYEVDLSALAKLDPEFGSTEGLRGRIMKRGPTTWIQLPFFNDIVEQIGFPGVRWVETDSREKIAQDSEIARTLAPMNQQDPGQLLDYVPAAETEERLGEETVGGAKTTHYRGRIVLDEIVRRLPAEERAGVEYNLDQVRRGTGEDEVPIEAWIDDAGLLRRLRMNYRFERNPETGAPFDAELVLNTELSDFGVRVEPREPAEDETVRIAEIVKAAEGAAAE